MAPPAAPDDTAGQASGVPWLIGDMVLVTGVTVLVKMQGVIYPAVQMVFIRAVIGLVIILPLIWRRRGDFRHMGAPWRNAGRVACNALALTLNFVALSSLPLALVNGVGFTRPLVSMALAVLLLGERVARRRWTGAVLAFGGVLVMIWPGMSGIAWREAGLIAAFASVFFGAMAAIQTRALRGESTMVMMVFYTFGLALLTLLPAAWFWVPVRAADWPALLAIGVLAQMAQLCFLLAYRRSEANVLAPFSYLSILLAIGAGWVFFGDPLNPAMALGAAIIIAALQLTRRRSVSSAQGGS